MLFNSIEFILFLPIVFFLYWFVFKKRQVQNLFIVVASYIFYGWWDWRFLVLIAVTSCCSFFSGLLLKHYNSDERARKSVSGANIVLNLGILFVFKYFNFFTDNFILLFRNLGFHLDVVTINVILPVGISFYTFQALSYTIDVYRNKIAPTHDIVEFFAFISFFPQLVAGPIERATSLLPQFQREREFNYADAVDGMRQMLWGFLKKVLVADNCAFYVNRYWDLYDSFSGISLFALAVLFTIQIYCDFSGYSDIAIGCARLFGINLKRNFEFPYFSNNIPEFWRRWHISLMTWFRDYVYIPLGGSRCAKWKHYSNIIVVWSISGLWHGANWTFVCWGLYHAFLLIIYNILGLTKSIHSSDGFRCGLKLINDILKIGLTFFLVVFGWILFRSENVIQAYRFISRMFLTFFDCPHIMLEKQPLYIAAIMLLVEWLQREKQHALQFPNVYPFTLRTIRWIVYIAITVIVVCFRGQSQTFIYFQF